jgi:rare lipoprotein A
MAEQAVFGPVVPISTFVRYSQSPMRQTLRLPLLFVMIGLAGCATQMPPPGPSQPPVVPQAPSIAAQPSPPPQPSTAERFFTQTGLASFYGAAHQGKTTADGNSFDQNGFTAAHRTLPFGTVVRVTNRSNGRTVNVKITDRGPHISGRIIDLSSAAAHALDMEQSGVTRVSVEAFRADQAG